MPFGDIKEEKKKEVSDKIKEIKKDMENPDTYVNFPIKAINQKLRLSKEDLLRLLKEQGPNAIDPDHNHLAEYLFPKKDTKNNKYLRRNILASFDFLLAYCNIYLK